MTNRLATSVSFLTLLGLLMGLPLLLGGCGSGGSSSPPTPVSRSGQVSFTILWPSTPRSSSSRLIPDATQSIRVDAAKVDPTTDMVTAVVASKVADRQQGVTKSTISFDLPLGRYRVTATAYALPGAQGSPIASATTQAFNVTAGANSPQTLTLNTTINRVDISSSSGSFSVVTNQVIQLTATARDATNNIVLVAPGDLQFTSTNPSVAAVAPNMDANGSPTGTAALRGGTVAGTVQITVTDFESNTLVTSSTVTVTVASAQGSNGTRFVYVANRTSNNVSGYTVDPNTGALTPVTSGTSPALAGTNPQAILVDPSGQFVYVANAGAGSNGTITGYTIDEVTGALVPFPAFSGAPYAAGATPIALAIDPTGHFLYSLDNLNGQVLMFTIDPNSGFLSSPGPPAPTGKNPVAITIAVTAAGNFAYVVNSGDNTVSQYLVPANGSLAPVGTTAAPTGLIPAAIAVSPNSMFVYIANSGSNNISAFRIDQGPNPGALIPLTNSPFTEEPGAASPVALVISGSTLYAANRDSNNVSIFNFNPATGAITLSGSSPAPVGNSPQSLAVDTTGRLLYVGNFISNNVFQFRVDPSTGSLSPLTPMMVPTGSSPIAIATTRGAQGNANITAS